ncbi:hypothetical protein [Streptomyces subrutilus]|uniref:hypothetical protein n=1 Tax=Streptomyces subrutilus TaxID=36818 RepID=UPI00123D49BE|nr:hypothetical protein [Streptomyces subrutilus]
MRLLLREFYRAYLADGVLPGGERRPDLRDHARWLARQGSDGARELWTRTAPPRHAATTPGRHPHPAPDPHRPPDRTATPAAGGCADGWRNPTAPDCGPGPRPAAPGRAAPCTRCGPCCSTGRQPAAPGNRCG